MIIQKTLVAGCKARIALIIIICFVAGFAISGALDSFFCIEYVTKLFTQESMDGTLWIENGKKMGLDRINALKTYPEVEDVSIQINCVSETTGGLVTVVSNKLLSTLNIPLFTGEWDYEKSEHKVIPAVVSYDLAGRYPIGSETTIDILDYDFEYLHSVKIRITGILQEFGGFLDLDDGQFVSYPSLRNHFYWHNANNIFIIPLDQMPNKNMLIDNIASTMVIHMTDDVAGNAEKRSVFQKKLFEDGMGISNTGEVLADRTKSIGEYELCRFKLMLWVFLILTMVGIVCYNLAFAYHKKRELLVLRLLGVTKSSLALNWSIMMGYAHLLPVVLGLSMGERYISNGQIWFPSHEQINRVYFIIGCFVFLGIAFFLLYLFLSTDISMSIKEEQ